MYTKLIRKKHRWLYEVKLKLCVCLFSGLPFPLLWKGRQLGKFIILFVDLDKTVHSLKWSNKQILIRDDFFQKFNCFQLFSFKTKIWKFQDTVRTVIDFQLFYILTRIIPVLSEQCQCDVKHQSITLFF